MDMSASSYPFFFYGTFFTAPSRPSGIAKQLHASPRGAHIWGLCRKNIAKRYIDNCYLANVGLCKKILQKTLKYKIHFY